MGFQAAHDRLRGVWAKVQVDSEMKNLLPRYYPVVSRNCLEVNEGEEPKVVLVGSSRWTLPQLFFTCSLVSFLFATGLAAGLLWGYSVIPPSLQQCPGPGTGQPFGGAASEAVSLRELPSPLRDGGDDDNSCFSAMLRVGGKEHPFEEITGVKGHIRPQMYGKVKEKTIWSYWYDPIDCPSSDKCKMPAVIDLCAESIRRNRGSFDFHLLHLDTVRTFVNMLELPLQFQFLQPVRQKESLMNVLLARYGGVALDLSMVLLRPLDSLWDELVLHEATFMGYVYRINGEPWDRPEASAPWFLMSRREGIFSTAVRNQMVNLCDAYLSPKLAVGDITLTPVLGSINSSIPSCTDDKTVKDPGGCPEPMQPRSWVDASLAPPRTDRKLILRDPRDGPHLPFAFLDTYSMGTWRVSDTAKLVGHPPQCASPNECWQKVFLPRFNSGFLGFVKLFRKGGALTFRSRKELLNDTDSFFFRWLSLAGASRWLHPKQNSSSDTNSSSS